MAILPLLLALQIGAPPVSPTAGTGLVDKPDPAADPRLAGTDEWFALPPEIEPVGTPTRTLAGDWNGDLHRDAAVLVDGVLFVVVAPGSARGGVRIDGLGPVRDFDVLPGGGPSGQDALITVGADGLRRHWFENGLDAFVQETLDEDAWLSARLVRVLDRASGAGPLLVGVADGGLDVLGFDPAQALSVTLLTHGSPVEDLEVLDWSGDGDEELAVMSAVDLAVYDLQANVQAVFPSTGETPIGIAPFVRALELHARLAWITAEAAPGDAANVGTRLHLMADGVVEPTVQLGALHVVELVGADLDGDASDELVLSHSTSEHQVILRGRAVPGDPLSPSFAAKEFDVLTVLPPDVALVDATPGVDVRTAVGTASGTGGGGGGTGGVSGQVLHPTPGGAGSPTAPGGAAAPALPGFVQGGRATGSQGASIPTGGLPLENPFRRNRALPAAADFDDDGDVDLLFPVSGTGGLLLHRGGLVDHRTLRTGILGSTLNSAGPDLLRLDFAIREPEVVPPAATHVELTVWRSDFLTAPTDGVVVDRQLVELGGEWPEDLSVFLHEETLPFHALYQLQLRLVELGTAFQGQVVRVYPTSTSTYSSSPPVFESLWASSSIRGGGVTTPKTGPVFVGGIAPRPHLDPFAPGVMPRAPGGGQIQ